jgi:hypothetical protein
MRLSSKRLAEARRRAAETARAEAVHPRTISRGSGRRLIDGAGWRPFIRTVRRALHSTLLITLADARRPHAVAGIDVRERPVVSVTPRCVSAQACFGARDVGGALTSFG